MRRQYYLKAGLTLGFFAAVNTLGIAQDLLGLEGWQAWERRQWYPASLTWPLEGACFLGVILAGGWFMYKAKRDEDMAELKLALCLQNLLDLVNLHADDLAVLKARLEQPDEP